MYKTQSAFNHTYYKYYAKHSWISKKILLKYQLTFPIRFFKSVKKGKGNQV